jgi:signal transduction histidine kinase
LSLDNENLKLKNENEKNKRNNLIIIFITGAGLFFFGLTWYFQRKRKNKIKELRKNFSMNIHDDLANKITVIKNDNIEIKKQLSKNKDLINLALCDRNDRIHSCCLSFDEAMHDIAWASKTENITIEELTIKIKVYIKNVSESFKIEITPTITCNKTDSIMSSIYAFHILSVVKESINNSVKYSEAKAIRLIATIENKNFNFEIKDDGKGFDISKGKLAGNGLANMKFRIEKIGGKFNIHSGINMGTSVVFSGRFF